jgi:hypothetical protein
MGTLEIFMLGLITVVVVIGVGWFIYESRNENSN